MRGKDEVRRIQPLRASLFLCGYIICWYVLNIYIHNFFTQRRSENTRVVDASRLGERTKPVDRVPEVFFPNLYRPTCEKVWRGDFSEDFLSRNSSSVVVVVSFCKGELNTLFGNLRDINTKLKGVFVYSKCGILDIPTNFIERFEGITEDTKKVVSLPNFGRVDHNIAHYIVNFSEYLAADDVVLFLEDNYHVVHQDKMEPVALPKLLKLAAGDLGFACRLIPRLDKSSQFSAWHETAKLHAFHMESYKSGATSYQTSDTQEFSRGENLGQWLESIKLKLPTPLTPVCYGGNFAARAANLHAAKDAAQRMELSLRRGDNIVEGHFAERTWAGLLTADIPDSVTNPLVSMRTEPNFHSADMPGMLVGCSEQS